MSRIDQATSYISLKQVSVLIFAVVTTLSATGRAAIRLNAKQQLGQRLFFDTNLSTPTGQACALP